MPIGGAGGGGGCGGAGGCGQAVVSKDTAEKVVGSTIVGDHVPRGTKGSVRHWGATPAAGVWLMVDPLP